MTMSFQHTGIQKYAKVQRRKSWLYSHLGVNGIGIHSSIDELCTLITHSTRKAAGTYEERGDWSYFDRFKPIWGDKLFPPDNLVPTKIFDIPTALGSRRGCHTRAWIPSAPDALASSR